MHYFHYSIFYTVFLITYVTSAGKDINSNMLSLLLNYTEDRKANNDIVIKSVTKKPVWFLNVFKSNINGDSMFNNTKYKHSTAKNVTKWLINNNDISSPAPVAEIITNEWINYDPSLSNNTDTSNKVEKMLTDELEATLSSENIIKEFKNITVDDIHTDDVGMEVGKTPLKDIAIDLQSTSVNKIKESNEMTIVEVDMEMQVIRLTSTFVTDILTAIISDAVSHYGGSFLDVDNDTSNIENVIEFVRSRLATLPWTCDINSNATDEQHKSNDIHERPTQKIEIKMYYESFCPYSRYFFATQLVPVVRKLGNYLDLYLYPYGNSETIDDNGLIKFKCMHGPAECYGNKLHACSLHILGYGLEAILFNNCLMDTTHKAKGSNDAAVDKCGKSMAVNPKPIKECAKGSKGTNLLKEYGEKRAQINFDYVPFVLIDGKEYEDENLVKDVCDLIRTPPNVCKMI